MRNDILPSLGLACGAALWGFYWIPVRGIENAGVGALWAGPVIFGASTLLFIPLVMLRLQYFAAHWRHTLVPGLLTGFAFALYIASINLTDVVRAILLFYMTPLWSTLLGLVVLKERLTINRVVALLLAFAGLYVVLAVEQDLPIPRNTGDWFALLSGVCWALGSLRLFQDGSQYIIEKVTMFVFFALLLSLALVIWQQGNFGGSPDFEALRRGGYWIALVALLMLPIVYLTIWPATLLSPGRVGMLLMVEVIVGVGSAAMLSGDPFGPREALGAMLILGAAAIEVMRQQRFDNSVIVTDPASTQD